MKAKIQVVFDMSFDDSNGECKTIVSFSLPEHPQLQFPENLKGQMMREINMLSGAIIAAEKQIFSESKPKGSK